MVDSILKDLNSLREKPVSLQKKFNTVSKAFLRIKKTKQANELAAFSDTLTSMKPLPTFILSPGLCDAAQDELLHMKTQGSHHMKKTFEDLDKHVGKYCYDFKQLFELSDHGGLDLMVPRCMISDHDPEREYRGAIFNREYKYIGIATDEFDGEEATCIMFADFVREKSKKRRINLEDYADLKIAYDKFDVNKDESVTIPELKLGLRALGYDVKNPVVYDIICTLDVPENKMGVDFNTFALAFDDALNDTSLDNVLYNLYRLFINDNNLDKISSTSINKLVREINENYTLNEIKEILNKAALDGNEIDYEEFLAIMASYYTADELNEIKDETKNVVTKTTITTNTNVKGKKR